MSELDPITPDDPVAAESDDPLAASPSCRTGTLYSWAAHISDKSVRR
jgi:hypothetical protein